MSQGAPSRPGRASWPAPPSEGLCQSGRRMASRPDASTPGRKRRRVSALASRRGPRARHRRRPEVAHLERGHLARCTASSLSRDAKDRVPVAWTSRKAPAGRSPRPRSPSAMYRIALIRERTGPRASLGERVACGTVEAPDESPSRSRCSFQGTSARGRSRKPAAWSVEAVPHLRARAARGPCRQLTSARCLCPVMDGWKKSRELTSSGSKR